MLSDSTCEENGPHYIKQILGKIYLIRSLSSNRFPCLTNSANL